MRMADRWPRSTCQCAIDQSCGRRCRCQTSSANTFINLSVCCFVLAPHRTAPARLPPRFTAAFSFWSQSIKTEANFWLFRPAWAQENTRSHTHTNTIALDWCEGSKDDLGAEFQWTRPRCVIITDRPQWGGNWGGGYKFASKVQKGIIKHFFNEPV